MARKIDEFEFRGSEYDWDTWFDGSIWVLESGEDFTIKTDSMRSLAITTAKMRGLGLRTSVNKDKNTVTLQAYEKKNGEQE